VVGLFGGLILVVVVFAAALSALVLTGGPGPCTPGGGVIEITDANAQSFQQKWDSLDAAQRAGAQASITVNESEATSRANREIRDNGAKVSDVRVCIHNGYGEVTGSVDAFLGSGNFKLRGAVRFDGAHPVLDFQDAEIGNLPGFVLAPFRSAAENALQDELDKVTVKHTYNVTLSEGQATIQEQP